MDCPCKECPNRGCGVFHSECEKYLEWKTYADELNKKIRKEKSAVFRNLKGYR